LKVQGRETWIVRQEVPITVLSEDDVNLLSGEGQKGIYNFGSFVKKLNLRDMNYGVMRRWIRSKILNTKHYILVISP
jgi:hypothetical protein